MINRNLIEEVTQKLVPVYDPLVIYVFGSYAWGTPDDESDLDLLVVVEKYKKSRHETLVDGHRALSNLMVPKDILVFTKEEFDRYSADITRLCYKVKHKGKIIYAKA